MLPAVQKSQVEYSKEREVRDEVMRLNIQRTKI